LHREKIALKETGNKGAKEQETATNGIDDVAEVTLLQTSLKNDVEVALYQARLQGSQNNHMGGLVSGQDFTAC
jgi:hypothetical protein